MLDCGCGEFLGQECADKLNAGNVRWECEDEEKREEGADEQRVSFKSWRWLLWCSNSVAVTRLFTRLSSFGIPFQSSLNFPSTTTLLSIVTLQRNYLHLLHLFISIIHLKLRKQHQSSSSSRTATSSYHMQQQDPRDLDGWIVPQSAIPISPSHSSLPATSPVAMATLALNHISRVSSGLFCRSCPAQRSKR